MKRSIALLGFACALYADSTVEGPRLGYVSSQEGIRGVLGILGASRLSGPLTKALDNAAVLPGQGVAFATNPAGELVRVNLADGTSQTVDTSSVSRVAASPAGEVAAAFSQGRVTLFAKDGTRLGAYDIPAEVAQTAVADVGNAVAVTVAEVDSEAILIVNAESSRRVFSSSKISAIAFIPGTSDLVFADGAGALYRLNGDLQFGQLGVAPGLKALAATGDKLIVATEHTIRAISMTGGEESSVDCSCTNSMARPIGNSNFLLTDGQNGPMWVVDAAGAQLKLAFIPEAVNE